MKNPIAANIRPKTIALCLNDLCGPKGAASGSLPLPARNASLRFWCPACGFGIRNAIAMAGPPRSPMMRAMMIDAIRSLPSLMFVGQASAWCQPFAGASAGLLAPLPSILARCLLGLRFLQHLIDVAGSLGEISHAKPAYNCSRRKAFQTGMEGFGAERWPAVPAHRPTH